MAVTRSFANVVLGISRRERGMSTSFDRWTGRSLAGRYANMDFIVLSALLGTVMLALTILYDICCQWSRNLANRMPQFPTFMQISKAQLRRAKYVLPKFHIYNHGPKCILNFSLNFLRWSAASDLEDPERWWSHINPVSMSTKEMGEGSRHDTIDDHTRSWNWRKITGFGKSLALCWFTFAHSLLIGLLFATRLKKALVMQLKHGQAFDKFNATFPPAVVDQWEKLVTEWDKDKTKKNPYEEPVAGKSYILIFFIYTAYDCSGTTMNDVRLELANEESADAARGLQTLHNVSAGKWLTMGLDLEDQQYVICTVSDIFFY